MSLMTLYCESSDGHFRFPNLAIAAVLHIIDLMAGAMPCMYQHDLHGVCLYSALEGRTSAGFLWFGLVL